MTIKGADVAPPLARCEEKKAALKVVCDDDFDITLSGEAEEASSLCFSQGYSAQYKTRPLFFEQRRYELIVEPVGDHTVEFWHENYHDLRQSER